ncbi:uncharacterized protein TRUGW13939_01242 [Talaromyces rugulosus]|uniref:Cyanovirin-N domain-containing protein n=1 Tax=Talaromyces rugulosus TaxID=121627 RepID=A0A7H8QJP6_TALRU|nr:uncharacterized protein TRUGW13939_01242 [Talaromyces rugulosus]QKX54158.1 hypothetical protein TRUGW13939_01242 [Talaromyces rugulosus]
MRYLAVFASILAVAAAGDFGSWSLYCGSSCSGGTLIGTGDLDSNVISSCTNLGATYDYCHLEVVQYTNMYRAVLSSDGTCGDSSNPVISAGGCTSAGSWSNYQIYYYA